MAGIHDGDLPPGPRLDSPTGAVLVEYHESRRLGPAGIFNSEAGPQTMTTQNGVLMRDQIARLVQDAVAQAQRAGDLPNVAMPEVAIERPQKAEWGDFATTFPLRAKRAVGPDGPNPMAIAGAVSKQLALDLPPYLATVEVAKP